MALDRDRAIERETELITAFGLALDQLTDDPPQVSESELRRFIQVTPPEEDEVTIGLIVVGRPGRHGSSLKPGHILLNMGEAMNIAASGVLTAGGALAEPWMIPFGLIALWGSLRTGMTRDLSELEASIIWTLWKYKDDAKRVPKADVLGLVNTELSEYGRPLVTEQMVNDATSALREMRCIRNARHNPGKWYLSEWVRVSYR